MYQEQAAYHELDYDHKKRKTRRPDCLTNPDDQRISFSRPIDDQRIPPFKFLLVKDQHFSRSGHDSTNRLDIGGNSLIQLSNRREVVFPF